MNHPNPPKWADRFLAWYCNPELLEEIQGDAHELYYERLSQHGKRIADVKYVYDVLRFFRWSNIVRTKDPHKPSAWNLWRFNLKVAGRSALNTKSLFLIKTSGVALCLSFTILLAAFLIQELSFDKFNVAYNRTYRITSRVDFHDHITHYAVTPLPIGRAMLEGIPEIKRYTRFMYDGQPVFQVDDKNFYSQVTLSADSNFLKVFSFEFIQGGIGALNTPHSIVLTETAAKAFFGSTDALSKVVKVGEHLLQVMAVIKDVPVNSHLQFSTLISWDSFDRWDAWGNLNAYTYVQLKDGADLTKVRAKMPALLKTFHELVAREYKATYEPVFEPLPDIHFTPPLDEDIVQKGSKTNLMLLAGVMIMLTAMGVINYVNLSMAETTTSLKKLGVIRIFGGAAGSGQRILLADAVLSLLFIVPLTALLTIAGWTIASNLLSVNINPGILSNPLFWIIIGVGLSLILVASRSVTSIIADPFTAVQSLKGIIPAKQGRSFRNVLVGIQFTTSIAMIALILITADQFNFIQNSDKGFEARNVILVKLRDTQHNKVSSFIEEARQLSGVSKVDGSTYAPGVIETKYVFRVEGSNGMNELLVPMMACGYDYLDVLNVKLSKGRKFDREHDAQGTYIINETAAREFGWSDPLGKRIQGPVDGGGDNGMEGEVIGVVHDFNFASLHARIEPTIIFLTPEGWSSEFVYVRTDVMAQSGIIPAIQKLFEKHWPSLPFEWSYLDTQYFSLYKKDLQMKQIFEAGLAISILIAILGIYSISALMTTLRTKEMSIRKVVGASGIQLFMLHVSRFSFFLIICILFAWPLVYWLSEMWLSNFAYRINLTFYHFLLPAGMAAVLLLATIGYHAVQGTRVNPADHLKCE